MTHFRGRIRGAHWGPTLDNLLIDFWRKHECLFNSSVDCYYDKDLKTKLWTEFAESIGKHVTHVERRSRSLRTQYGRVLWHPEKDTAQQKMLREKLDFLRPYIVRRRSDSYLEDKFDDRDEDDETEGSIDQEMGSSFGSPLDDDVAEQDLDDEGHPSSSLHRAAPMHCPTPPPPQVMSFSSHPSRHSDDGSCDQPEPTVAPNTSKHNILNQFAEVMLADMRQIKDPLVLMRLRRDITDLVFRAVEEDVQNQSVRVGSMSTLQESCSRSQQTSSQRNYSWRQRFLKRKNMGCDIGKRIKRREEMNHLGRISRAQFLQTVQQGQAQDGMSENGTQVVMQGSDIKREIEPHMLKIEEETLPLA